MTFKLKEIAMVKTGYLPRSDKAHDIGAYLIQPKDISAHNVVDFEHLDTIRVKLPEKHALSNGEVLLVSRGRFAAALFERVANFPFIASSLLLRITAADKRFLPEYICLYLNSDEGRRELNKLASSVAIPTINKAQLEELKIPLIPLEEQEKLIDLTREYTNWKVLRQVQDELQNQKINYTISKTIRK